MADPTSISTERLTLSPMEPSDIDALIDLIGDRRVYETTLNIPHPYERSDAEWWIQQQYDVWEQGGCAFGIYITEPRTLIGGITLMTKVEHERAELGYWIGVPYWNNGYATEASKAIIDFGFRSLGLQRIWAGHFGHNDASGKVQRNAGLSFEGVLRNNFKKDGRYVDDVVHSILREEWEGAVRTSQIRHPVLETDRLTLRPPVITDQADLYQLYRHKEVADGVLSVPHPYTQDDARSHIRKLLNKNQSGRSHDWVITLKGQDRLIGLCGFAPDDRHKHGILGYCIRPDHWGRGYMTETVARVIEYAFNQRDPSMYRLTADHYPENPASGRVSEKVGLTREGILRGHLFKEGRHRDVVRWAIIKPDWTGEAPVVSSDSVISK